MAMEVCGNYSGYQIDYLEKVQAEQDKTDEADQVQIAEDKMKGRSTLQDEYISSEKSGSKPSGLYRLGQDDNGKPKILYDDPKKTEKVKTEPEQKAEECTTNTDNVDREIEKLKEEKKQLELQIKSVTNNEEKVKELKNNLAQIEGEIIQKDNDVYRRQNAVIS